MNTEYLKESVGKYLCRALCEVAKRRPERPIEFLAYYLISLYEKNLELQREEKKVELQEGEESVEDHLIAPIVSQMFTERLSISREVEVSPAPTPSSTTVEMDADDTMTEDEKESTCDIAETDKELTEVKSLDVYVTMTEDKKESTHDIAETDKELTDVKSLDADALDIPNIPVRKYSTLNDPVTKAESREFGTTDPFLARRSSNLFDVNAAPIGNENPQ